MSTPIKIFISYAHEDEVYKDELKGHLSKLGNLDIIKDWDDRLILPGDNWEEQIQKKLQEAQVFLFLLSEAALTSDYIQEKEAPVALSRHRAGAARAIPVIVGACDFYNSPFREIQATPTGLQPISSMEAAERESFYKDFTINLLLAIMNIRETTKGTAAPVHQQVEGASDTVLAGRLSRALVNLDYKKPVSAFNQCLAYGNKAFAFLVHGPRGTGHDWFLRVVLKQWFEDLENQQFETLRFSLGNLFDTDIYSICDEIQIRNNLPGPGFESIVRTICTWTSSKPVVIRADDPQALEPEGLQQFIQNFCAPLFRIARSSPQARFPLLLFFVLREPGRVAAPFQAFSPEWDPEQSVALALPGLEPLKPEDLEQWATNNLARISNMGKRVEELILPQRRAAAIQQILEESGGRMDGQQGVINRICSFYGLQYPQILKQLPSV